VSWGRRYRSVDMRTIAEGDCSDLGCRTYNSVNDRCHSSSWRLRTTMPLVWVTLNQVKAGRRSEGICTEADHAVLLKSDSPSRHGGNAADRCREVTIQMRRPSGRRSAGLRAGQDRFKVGCVGFMPPSGITTWKVSAVAWRRVLLLSVLQPTNFIATYARPMFREAHFDESLTEGGLVRHNTQNHVIADATRRDATFSAESQSAILPSAVRRGIIDA
jgi:hypothetical protein